MKKTLRLVLALALALVMVFTLVACEKEPEEQKPAEEKPAPAPAVPTAEGKITFCLTLVETELPAYASIFLCGDFNEDFSEEGHTADWGKSAAEMKKLEGSANVYYVQVDKAKFEQETGQKGQYQLTLGYNAASGVPAASQGVNWTYKFDQTTSGLDNPSFTHEAGSQVVNLGDVKFSTIIPAPEILEKVTLRVTLAEALPEGWKLLMPGSIVAWNNTVEATEMKTTDRKVWTFELTEFPAGDYEFQVLAAKADATGDIEQWSNQLEGKEGNQKVSIAMLFDNDVIDVYGEGVEVSFPETLFMPTVTVTMKITLAEGFVIPEGKEIYFNGSISGWKMVKFVAGETAGVYTVTIEGAGLGAGECGVLLLTAEEAAAGTWAWKCDQQVGGANLSYTLEATHDGQVYELLPECSWTASETPAA